MYVPRGPQHGGNLVHLLEKSNSNPQYSLSKTPYTLDYSAQKSTEIQCTNLDCCGPLGVYIYTLWKFIIRPYWANFRYFNLIVGFQALYIYFKMASTTPLSLLI